MQGESPPGTTSFESSTPSSFSSPSVGVRNRGRKRVQQDDSLPSSPAKRQKVVMEAFRLHSLIRLTPLPAVEPLPPIEYLVVEEEEEPPADALFLPSHKFPPAIETQLFIPPASQVNTSHVIRIMCFIVGFCSFYSLHLLIFELLGILPASSRSSHVPYAGLVC